jgi:hypothetical protein
VCRVSPLQQLEHLLVPGERRAGVLGEDVAVVAGNLAEAVQPGRRHEVDRHHGAVLEGQITGQLVHAEERRGDPVPLVDQVVRLGDPGVGPVGRRLGRRAREHHFRVLPVGVLDAQLRLEQYQHIRAGPNPAEEAELGPSRP